MSTNLNLGGGLSALSLGLPAGIIAIITVILLIIHLIIILILAEAVRVDAHKKNKNGSLFLVTPGMWFVVVLFTGGYVGTLAYWFIHYSAQRNRNENGA